MSTKKSAPGVSEMEDPNPIVWQNDTKKKLADLNPRPKPNQPKPAKDPEKK